MSTDRIALFDMDGTIANYEVGMRDAFRNITGKELPGDLHDRMPVYDLNCMSMIKSQVGWWKNLKPIPSGLELMEYCVELGAHIHILTQAPRDVPFAWGEKYEWCLEHVSPIYSNFSIAVVRGGARNGEENLYGIGKGTVYGRVLVDDYPPFMDAWLANRKNGLGIMPKAALNGAYEHPQVIRMGAEWKTPELVERLTHAILRK